MDGVIMVFSQNEIMLMIGVVSVLLICITILTILDIREYLKAKKGLLVEDNTLSEEYVEEESKEEPITVSLVEEDNETLEVPLKEDKPEEIYFEEMADESYEIKPEISPIIEESEEIFIPKVEAKEEKKVLDAFEEFEEIENNLPNNKDDITNFEAEQERTAIISLDELLKRSDELYNGNEVVQYDDGNEPISIDEVIKMFKRDDDKSETIEVKELPEVFQEVVQEKEQKELYSKKETIPFISSIYGIEKENNALEFENTATYEKLDREQYDDFVTQLKEMNENK